MSHAMGEVYRDGRIVGYYEYNGTADVVCPRIQYSPGQVNLTWRGDNWRECTCGNPPEDVILYSDYGHGFHWAGKACMACKAIVDGLRPYGNDYDEQGVETKSGRPTADREAGANP